MIPQAPLKDVRMNVFSETWELIALENSKLPQKAFIPADRLAKTKQVQ